MIIIKPEFSTYNGIVAFGSVDTKSAFILRSADRKQKANKICGISGVSYFIFDILYLISQGLAYKPETAHRLSKGGFVSEVIYVSVVMRICGGLWGGG